ncbi:hypothetical protein [Chromobacterium violaceum]|uniref:hypothetical protein n=1 Tax=Chromobacterium violaceum TaxID=536 RepID=UPI003CF7051D
MQTAQAVRQGDAAQDQGFIGDAKRLQAESAAFFGWIGDNGFRQEAVFYCLHRGGAHAIPLQCLWYFVEEVVMRNVSIVGLRMV